MPIHSWKLEFVSPPVPKRKLKHVFLRILEDLGNEFTPRFREQFKKEVVPVIMRRHASEKELTEEEYHRKLAQMRRELPQVIRNVLKANCALPPGCWIVDGN